METTALNRRHVAVGVGGIVTGGALTWATTGDRGRAGDDRVDVIAHRGFDGSYPENTTRAFQQAASGGDGDSSRRRGADWIELDVRPTGDGDIAVYHEPELGTLTDTRGTIYDTSSRDVFSAEVADSGATVPSLEDAMAVIPSRVGVNIDIKAGTSELAFALGASDDPESEREDWTWLDDVVDIATGYANELLLSTFWEGALWYLAEFHPDVPRAYIAFEDLRQALEFTDTYATDALNPRAVMIAGTSLFPDGQYREIDLVTEAHDRDIPVNVWTIAAWDTARELIEAGVDGLILESPDIVRWDEL